MDVQKYAELLAMALPVRPDQTHGDLASRLAGGDGDILRVLEQHRFGERGLTALAHRPIFLGADFPPFGKLVLHSDELTIEFDGFGRRRAKKGRGVQGYVGRGDIPPIGWALGRRVGSHDAMQMKILIWKLVSIQYAVQLSNECQVSNKTNTLELVPHSCRSNGEL